MDQLTFLRAAQGIKTNRERQIPLGTKEVRLILIFEPLTIKSFRSRWSDQDNFYRWHISDYPGSWCILNLPRAKKKTTFNVFNCTLQIYSGTKLLNSYVVSEPDPRKIRNRVWEIGWGGSLLCAQNAGALPIGSWLHVFAYLLEIPSQPTSIGQGDGK